MYRKYQKYKTKYLALLDLRGGGEVDVQDDARSTFGLFIYRLKPNVEKLIQTGKPLNRLLDTSEMSSIIRELENYSQDYYHILFDQDKLKEKLKEKLDLPTLPEPGDIESEIFKKMAACDDIYKKCPISREDLAKAKDLLDDDDLQKATALLENPEKLDTGGKYSFLFILISYFLNFIYEVLVHRSDEELMQSNEDCRYDDGDDEG